MFNTLLIANRGEIACRIIKTAKRLGIKTIAVYSDADQNALHVRHADCAFYLGPSKASLSYLNIDAIIKIARKAKAEAIHPGYGFLSENPLFAQKCIEANICFIGPSVKALKIMASKQQAKICLNKSKVPLTPGYHGTLQTYEVLAKEAKKIGFPILIKAASGGGGKGMRIVNKASDLKVSIESAKREALNYFNDDTLILEKFIKSARHVEVQIFADTKGQIIHLFDRDCSLQRRHQKIIEEALAPNISPKTRTKMYAAAINVAKAIDYVGAGTVEFLLLSDEVFYFMEMNTRLQVEHPVTEAITGLDLVEWQIRIANGESLPKEFKTIKPMGHAIECRVYAEDPLKDFLPCQGKIYICEEPTEANCRIDRGYGNEDVISLYYDPLIAKIITQGANRQEAIQNMQSALKHYALAGVATNCAFLKEIFSNHAFIKGEVATDFLAKHNIAVKKGPVPLPIIFLLFAHHYLNLYSTNPNLKDFFAFQQFLPRTWELFFVYQDSIISATVTAKDKQHFSLFFAGKTFELAIPIKGTVEHVNKASYQGIVFFQGTKIYCFYQGDSYLFTPKELINFKEPEINAHSSPMPGTVVAVLKNKGDKITKDESIIIIEAMKMEHAIKAQHAGIITDIYYHKGDQVVEGAQLFALQG